MAISAEEVVILIHESALDEMIKRRTRLEIQLMNKREELRILTMEINRKMELITSARDNLLVKGCV